MISGELVVEQLTVRGVVAFQVSHTWKRRCIPINTSKDRPKANQEAPKYFIDKVADQGKTNAST